MLGLIVAFILDLVIGDPVYAWHPVRLMGRAIEQAESFLRRHIVSKKFGGAVLALSFPCLVFLLAGGMIFFLGKIHWLLGWSVNALGIYMALSVSDLHKEGTEIYRDLVKGDIPKARSDLARIVGRDTRELDQTGILRASIETVAESIVDGIIAPLFYAALAGAPLALAYKAVNTLDSMIGHLDERYRDFGFVAAKQDELWNWIPARISYGAIALAAFFMTGRFRQALVTGWKDGVVACSGSSDIPEATAAGSLGLQLGGVNFYAGRKVEKPFLGMMEKSFEVEDLQKMLELMMMASWVSLAGAVLLKYGMRIFVPC